MAIRRPPTTFSDSITGADLASDIAISTTGNIATTGSGSLTVAGNTTLSGTNNLGSNPTVTLGTNTAFPEGTIVGYKQHNLITRHAISNSNNTGSQYDTLAGWSWLQLELSYTLKTASPIIHLSCHLCMATTNHGERLSLKVHRVDSSGNSVAPVSGFVTSQESSRRHCHASDLYFNSGSDEHLLNFAFTTQDDLSLSAGTTVYYRVYGNQNADSITFYVNRPDNDSNYWYIPMTVSSLSLMEVVE